MTPMACGCTVRRAVAGDSAALLALMHALAVFEGYRDQFRVTEQDLLTRGLQGGPGSILLPQFVALVAQSESSNLLGYAVTVTVPFTYDLRPNLLLKELYVTPDARGEGVGRALMDAVQALAAETGSGRIKWDVLRTNHPAKAFYDGLGAGPDAPWEGWILHLP